MYQHAFKVSRVDTGNILPFNYRKQKHWIFDNSLSGSSMVTTGSLRGGKAAGSWSWPFTSI